MKSLLMSFTVFITVLLSACATGLSSKINSDFKKNNGAQILYFEDHELPLVSFGWAIKSGSADDPMSFSGLSSLTLSQWTDQPELEEELRSIGGSVSRQLYNDFVVIKLTGLSDQKEKLLSIGMKYLKSPVFNLKKFNEKKRLVISQLESDADNEALLASLQFHKEIYGGHPYGRRISGNLSELQNITFENIKKRFQDWIYLPNMVFFAAGDFDEEFKKALSFDLESMSGGVVRKNYFPKVLKIKNTAIEIFDNAESSQSFIYMGHPSISRGDGDYLALELATLVLGGLSTSRLAEKIRLDKGLTYSVQSAMVLQVKSGHFEVSTTTKNENVGALIRETLEVLNDFVKNGVTASELLTAKNFYTSIYLRETETVFDQALFTLGQVVYGLPQESVSQTVNKINSLSLSQVNEAIRKNLYPHQLKIVILGPKDKVLPQVKNLAVVELKELSDL